MVVFFLKLVNLSIFALPLILFIMFYRLIDKKIPKWIRCALWAVVAIRLICPVNIESPIGLMPDFDIRSIGVPNTEELQNYAINGISDYEKDFENGLVIGEVSTAEENTAYNNQLEENLFGANLSEEKQPSVEVHNIAGGASIDLSPNRTAKENTVSNALLVLSYIWLAGASLFVLYFIFETIKMHRLVGSAINIHDNVYICDDINAPFVMGIVAPKIYFPSSMDVNTQNSVLMHENAHISRLDYLWKPMGFLVLALHWFNPVCILAYVLFCNDIEYACDEKAIRNMQYEERKSYSEALFAYSIRNYSFIPDRLAFSESSVKRRIKNVRNFKNQAVWAVALALIVCALTGCALFTHSSNQSAAENTTEILKFTDGFCLYSANIEGVILQPSITFKREDLSFTFSYDALSSYLSWGYYEIKDGMIYCHTSDGQFDYVFEICEDDTLILNGELSSKVYISDKNLSLSGTKFWYQKVDTIEPAYAPENVPTVVTLSNDSEYVYSKWDEERIRSVNFLCPEFEICVVKDGAYERKGIYNKENDILVYISGSTSLGIYCGTKYINIGTGIALSNHWPYLLFLDVTGDGNKELIVMCGDSEKSALFAIDINKAEIINDSPANIYINNLFSDYSLTGYGNHDGNTCVKIEFTLKNGSSAKEWIPVYSNENASVDMDTIRFRFDAAPCHNVMMPELMEGKADINGIFSNITVCGVASINDGLDKRNLANLIVRLDTKYNPESGRIELNSIEKIEVVLHDGADWGHSIDQLIYKLPPIDSDTFTGDAGPAYMSPVLIDNGVMQDRITASFGERNRPDESIFHTGIDIAAETGTEVVAVAEGKVVTVSASEELGHYIIIKHTDSYYSLYGHLSKTLVSKNESVSAGSVIGNVGATGMATGPNLHFAILGNYMDENGAVVLRYVEPVIE